MSERKIVQIAGFRPKYDPAVLFALADDGTLWRHKDPMHSYANHKCDPDVEWTQVTPLPERGA